MEAKTNAETLDTLVRRRLRQLRQERGLTLQQVAENANIDISTLSRLEAGKRRLALDHIPALATALGVTADRLLGTTAPANPRVHSRPHRYDGMTMWPLTQSAAAGAPQAYKILIAARRNAPPTPLPSHEGHEWLYVLNGRLRLLLGEDEHTIVTGEAVEFSTWTPHWFGAIDGPVEVIGLFGPTGERFHLRR